MTRLFAALLAFIALAPGLLVVAGAQGGANGPAGEELGGASTVGGDSSDLLGHLLTLGAETYAWHCAVCHGATGGGIEEARLAFPAGDRRCTRCHKPSNRVVQPLDRPFVDNDMFSIGDPPAVHPTAERPHTLGSSASVVALFEYIKTTMPRYDPGRLSDHEYWSLTALLLDMNGRGDELEKVAELAGRD